MRGGSGFLEELDLDRLFAKRKKDTLEDKKWDLLYDKCAMASLAMTAAGLHELIHFETKGKYTFEPGSSMREVGGRIEVDLTGKKGFPLSWHLKASEETYNHFELSSKCEGALHRRILNDEKIDSPIVVHGKMISAKKLNKLFEKYHRDNDNTTNGMPMAVESAFYHLPELNLKYKVIGFRYPHPVSTFIC